MLQTRIKLLLALVILVNTPSVAAAALQLLSPYGGSSCGASTFATAIDANGVLTCSPPTASTPLSGITAATGANTIDNTDNAQVWQWKLTTADKIAFRFTKSAASTATGTPVLLQVDTLAASTAVPMLVKSRGTEVYRVAHNAAQLWATSGNTNAPSYSFLADPTSGVYFNPSGPRVIISVTGGGNDPVRVSAFDVQVSGGLVNRPGLTDNVSANTGLSWVATNTMAIANVTDGEWCRFITRALQCSRGSSDATAYAFNAHKSRGTVASPTVITSGDDLLTTNGHGYVGSTNTYVQATQILHDSTGTISDSTSGIGGLIKFSTAKVGTVGVTLRWTMDDSGNLISAGVTQANLGAPADGSIVYCSDCTIANPCAGSGTGAIAKRLNGAWACN